jgi:hypothetical protein
MAWVSRYDPCMVGTNGQWIGDIVKCERVGGKELAVQLQGGIYAVPRLGMSAIQRYA